MTMLLPKIDKTTLQDRSASRRPRDHRGRIQGAGGQESDTIFRIKDGKAVVSNIPRVGGASKGQAVKATKEKAPEIIKDDEEKLADLPFNETSTSRAFGLEGPDHPFSRPGPSSRITRSSASALTPRTIPKRF